MCSVAAQCGRAVWVFSTSGFHRFLATKPVSSETSKAERRSSGVHSSIWDSWPIAFSGYPRGPRVGCETTCPRHTAPNLPAETRSRTVELLKGARLAGSHGGRTLKQVLQIVIAVAVEAPNQDVLPRSLQLSVDTTVIGAA